VQATRSAKRSGAAAILVAAAKRYGVPLWALVGVKLKETGNSSSAANPFQFEPGAAAEAGVRNVNSLKESANGAAKLLAKYRKEFGSWNAAFEAWNAGPGNVGKGVGYNEADIKAKLEEFASQGSTRDVSSLGEEAGEDFLFPWKALAEGITGEGVKPLNPEGGKGAAAEASNAIGGLSGLISIIESGETWIRLLEILAGAVLLYLGLKALTGAGVSDIPGARAAKLAVAK